MLQKSPSKLLAGFSYILISAIFGGLAYYAISKTPRSSFFTATAAGILLFILCFLALVKARAFVPFLCFAIASAIVFSCAATAQHLLSEESYFIISPMQEVAQDNYANFTLGSLLRGHTAIVEKDSPVKYFANAFASKVLVDDTLFIDSEKLIDYDFYIEYPYSRITIINPNGLDFNAFYVWQEGLENKNTKIVLLFSKKEKTFFVMSETKYYSLMEVAHD